MEVVEVVEVEMEVEGTSTTMVAIVGGRNSERRGEEAEQKMVAQLGRTLDEGEEDRSERR